jgi:hypothetical protein
MPLYSFNQCLLDGLVQVQTLRTCKRFGISRSIAKQTDGQVLANSVMMPSSTPVPEWNAPPHPNPPPRQTFGDPDPMDFACA